MALASPSTVDTLTTQHNLKDVAWIDVSEWGVLVGFANGTSRYVDSPTPAPRRAPLKKKYRA
jgi:hypothetical protein